MMLDISEPSVAVAITGLGTMLVVTLAHALRNLWKKTLQDSIEIDDSKRHSDLIATLLTERATHNQDLLTCYEKYNKLVSEYTEILSATREARREIEFLREEVRNLKSDIENQQHVYSTRLLEMETKLDKALKEKHELYEENIRLKERLDDVTCSN